MYCDDRSGYHSPTEITNPQWEEAGLCHLPSLSKYMDTIVLARHGGTCQGPQQVRGWVVWF